MRYTPAAEITERLSKLRILMEKASLDGAFFHHKVDYFYLTGTMQNGILFVPADDDPIFFVKRAFPRARKESPLKRILPIRSSKEIVSELKPMKRVGLQLDVMSYNDVMQFKKLLGSAEIVDSSPLTRELRKYKSPYEISLMKKAGAIGKKVYARVPELLKEGMTEIELGGLLEAHAKALGHEGILRTRSLMFEAYSWHILSGTSGTIVSQVDTPAGGLGLSPAFPMGAGMKKLKAHEPIMIDFPICYQGYLVDETRMFAIGSMPELFLKAYDACREIQYRILDKALTGMGSDKLFEYSLDLARQMGFGANYLGVKQHRVRFLAHGIGLELSDMPFIAASHKYPIEKNTVLAIEPKMVFPGKGICGIENTVLMEDGAYRVLSNTDERVVVV